MKKVRIVKQMGAAMGALRKGDTATVPDHTAEVWTRVGLAEEVKTKRKAKKPAEDKSMKADDVENKEGS